MDWPLCPLTCDWSLYLTYLLIYDGNLCRILPHSQSDRAPLHPISFCVLPPQLTHLLSWKHSSYNAQDRPSDWPRSSLVQASVTGSRIDCICVGRLFCPQKSGYIVANVTAQVLFNKAWLWCQLPQKVSQATWLASLTRQLNQEYSARRYTNRQLCLDYRPSVSQWMGWWFIFPLCYMAIVYISFNLKVDITNYERQLSSTRECSSTVCFFNKNNSSRNPQEPKIFPKSHQ